MEFWGGMRGFSGPLGVTRGAGGVVIHGAETTHSDDDARRGFGVTWGILGRNPGILGTKSVGLGSVGIPGSIGLWVTWRFGAKYGDLGSPGVTRGSGPPLSVVLKRRVPMEPDRMIFGGRTGGGGGGKGGGKMNLGGG